LPAIELCGKSIDRTCRIRELGAVDLEQEERERDFTIEVARELTCASRQSIAKTVAFGLADLSKPPVLQHREERHESEEQCGDDDERWAESPPHDFESSTSFAGNQANRPFLPL
jgi:hypothetical protein